MEKYRIAKYFDNYFVWYVSLEMSLEEAENTLKMYKDSTYTSYSIKKQ